MQGKEMPTANHVCVCIGSNMPDAENAVGEAIAWLSSLLCHMKCSGAFPSEPEGSDTAGRMYRNAVATGFTKLSDTEIVRLFREYENTHGRIRGNSCGDVAIDIDLVIFNCKVKDISNFTSDYFARGRALIIG